ncbi:hypothetical protein, partial [Streptomyces sp. NPDC005408]|uniref:hypothetical protein n=1 Tax=Streptomyces sp. NPDC005408 TaxID=3155341 RepID=UPI0033A765D7
MAAAAAAGCGSESGGAVGGGGRVGGATADRAQQVANAWEGSQAARQWREGFFSLDVWDELPQNAFRSGEDKEAYANGNFELRGSLPGSAVQGRIRWDDGSSLSTTVNSAQTVYGQLDTSGDTGKNPLIITGAELGEMTMTTSRGPARVPAWFFSVKGYDTPLKQVAVSPSMLPKSPIKPLQQQSDHQMPLQGLSAVSKDGRTVTVTAGHGA